MAYRELHVIEIKEVLRLRKAGLGYRTIADRTRVDRKAVRRYVEAAGDRLKNEDGEVSDELVALVVEAVRPGGSHDVGASREQCREHADLIKGWVTEGCKAPKLVRLLLRHTGSTVPVRTMQRFLAEEVQPVRDTVRVVEGKPGVLEMDFLKFGEMDLGDGPVKLYGLLCTAAYSRHQYVWLCLSQTRDDVIEGLEAAWSFFGGVFPVVQPDNLKPLVSGADAVDPTLAIEFVEYMQARGFQLDTARVRRPKDKAKVERQVQYVRNDFFAGERFSSLAEARSAAEAWCTAIAGKRIHGTTRRAPLERFEAEERCVLLRAPTEPYDTPTWTNHRVGKDHAVVVRHAVYTVPYWITVRTQLRVRADRTTVKLFQGRRMIKLHPRQPDGGASIDPKDLPPTKALAATRDTKSLAAKCAEYGPSVALYAERLLEGPRVWSQMRHVYRLLRLAERYGSADLDAACAQALQLDVVDVKRIDGMLARGGVVAGQSSMPQKATAPLSAKPRFARDPAEFASGVARATR
jgi:transposase